jgi:hypothetical protein
MNDCTKDRYVQAVWDAQVEQRERDLQVLRRRVQVFDAEAKAINAHNAHNERTTRRSDRAVDGFFIAVVAVALAAVALVLVLL